MPSPTLPSRWAARATLLALTLVGTLGAFALAGTLGAFALAGTFAFVPAAQAQDAGTESVFSQGTGYRALGMGSAFVAVSDDASAASWNPGGLGRVSRLEFQAGQTSYFGIDVNESYAAVVMPSWRWGTGSATFRHFGVGGIDHRDDRNLLLDSDESDSETEIGFGYGRAFGEVWSFGGNVKARRHSLAGLSASGYGIDVGVSGQPGLLIAPGSSWAPNVTWGLTIGNLVKPSMRLDRENVADPTIARTGVAWRSVGPGVGTVIAALDLSRSGASPTRLHAGVEMRPIPQFAIRSGLTGGELTAGAGIRWRDASLDYAYEANAIDPIHRVGIAYAFGPSVSESRESAARQAEETLQAKIDAAQQKRQAEQITTLLAQAEEKRTARQWDDALELLLTVSTLDPGDPRAARLELQCLLSKAKYLELTHNYADAAVAYERALGVAPSDTAATSGRQRCEKESALRAVRSTELRRQYETAMNAFSGDHLLEARRGFQAVLAAEPQNVEAAAMLEKVRDAIGRKTESLMRQAGRATEGGRLAEAGAALDQVAALSPEADGLAAAQSALARARANDPRGTRARTAFTPMPTPAPVLSKRERKDLAQLYARGVEAMNQRRSDDALRYWELVWSTDPNYQRVREYLKREYLTRGMESFAGGRLDEAVGFWEKALRVDPNDERASGYLARAQKQMARSREILGGR